MKPIWPKRPSTDSVGYDHRAQATGREIDFVRGLGQHAVSKGTNRQYLGTTEDRLHLLRGYLAGMELRTDWGVIDQERVRAEVLEQIAVEVKHRAAFIPRNGHGLFGSREYARRANLARTEIRRSGDDDDAS